METNTTYSSLVWYWNQAVVATLKLANDNKELVLWVLLNKKDLVGLCKSFQVLCLSVKTLIWETSCWYWLTLGACIAAQAERERKFTEIFYLWNFPAFSPFIHDFWPNESARIEKRCHTPLSYLFPFLFQFLCIWALRKKLAASSAVGG